MTKPAFVPNADVSIVALAGDFDFSDSDGDSTRLCMVEGQLEWLAPDGAGGWRTLNSGPLRFDQGTRLLVGSTSKATLSAQDVPRLLQLVTPGHADVTFVAVHGDFEFVDLDGDRNRVSMVNGALQWTTPDGSGGWRALFSGPSLVFNPGSRQLRCGGSKATLSPEDASRLMQVGRVGAAPAAAFAEALQAAGGAVTQVGEALQAAAVPVAQYPQPTSGAPAAQPMSAPRPVVMGIQTLLDQSGSPVQVTCPGCHNQVVTLVEHKMGTGSWAVCCCVCCFGAGVLSWGGLLPFCVQDCQDAHHTCPACRARLGTKTFLC